MESFFEKRNLVWYSTPASIEAGKTSLLAAIETLLCVAAWWYFYFAGWFTWWTIGIGLVSSLIVLLRCDASTKEGLRAFKKAVFSKEIDILRQNHNLNKSIKGIFLIFLKVFLLIIKLLFISISYRMFYSLKYFIQSFVNIPNNWRNLLWSNDITNSPELMPKISKMQPRFSLYGRIDRFYKYSKNLKSLKEMILLALIIIIYLPIFIPAFLYRFAIKSTAWLWFPLIYIQRSVQNITTKPFVEKRELITEQQSGYLNIALRFYSGFFIAGVIFSVLYPQWVTHKEYMPFAPLIGFIENYRPNLMQLLAFFSAALSLGTFAFCTNPLHLHVKSEADFARHESKFNWLIFLLKCSNVLFITIMFFGFLSFMFLKTDMPLHNLPDYAVKFMTNLLVTPINLKFW